MEGILYRFWCPFLNDSVLKLLKPPILRLNKCVVFSLMLIRRPLQKFWNKFKCLEDEKKDKIVISMMSIITICCIRPTIIQWFKTRMSLKGHIQRYDQKGALVCGRCNASYVGKAKPHLKMEHFRTHGFVSWQMDFIWLPVNYY